MLIKQCFIIAGRLYIALILLSKTLINILIPIIYIEFLCINLLIYSYEGIRSPGASDGKNGRTNYI